MNYVSILFTDSVLDIYLRLLDLMVLIKLKLVLHLHYMLDSIAFVYSTLCSGAPQKGMQLILLNQALFQSIS